MLVWMTAFAAVLAVTGSYALHATSGAVQAQSRAATEHFTRLRANLLSAFDAMQSGLTAQPCSAAFGEQLRKIAYQPDGLNEFLYAPGGRVECSNGLQRFGEPVDLGPPDIAGQGGPRNLSFWMDHDLGFLGLAGMRGTIVLMDPYGIVVPSQKIDLTPPGWLSAEVVLVPADGGWVHRSGGHGIYEAAHAAGDGFVPAEGAIYRTFCDPKGMHCVAMRADLVRIAADETWAVSLAMLVAAAIATCVSGAFGRAMTWYWSFESRFRRHLDSESVVCLYQPVMALDSGEIAGCEVLARWRDIDDRIVLPDRFIDIVERRGMTLRFTELVAERACADLSAVLPTGRRLQVNFNIFPCDLDSVQLSRVFAGFLSQPDRFDVVLEIIESDEIPGDAQREIEALRRLGIKTYIDDFGTGYSNMQNLAALSVDGVKLDRAFAMAPDNSMMAQMLRHAVDMIHATGRAMVVEGVETAERLELLRAMQARVDYVQGYLISRPLDIASFASFVADRAAGTEPAAA